jgi:hypothetical protein
VAIAQGAKDIVSALVFAEVEDGLIRRLDMCMPELYRWRRSAVKNELDE